MKLFKKRCLSFAMAAMVATGSFSALGMPKAAAVDTNQIVRVGLYYGSTALTDPKLENVDTSGYALGYYSGTSFVSETTIASKAITMKVVDGCIQVSDTDTGSVLYTAPSTTEHLAIHPSSALTWFKGYKWYGDFVYQKNASGTLSVINYVEIEDYVKGVLPYEMSPSWEIEALKAQAVCARSYALGSMDKHTKDGFDVCNTTDCQVYLGANQANANSDAAVTKTTGEYLTYNGKLAVGYFFSSDGGATEDAANVWGGDYGYLKGKVDPYEDTANALKGVWSVTLTADEVKAKVNAAGYSIGDVVNVQVTKRTDVDNVNEVTVTDSTGKQVVISKAKTRTVFGVNSIRYTITPDTAATKTTGNAMLAPTITKTANKVEAVAAAPQVALSKHKVTVNSKAVDPQAYLINNENYFKLRDIAYVLSGTGGQFNVGFDAEKNNIILTSGEAYQAVGGEMTNSANTAVQSCTSSNATIMLDGKLVSLTGYRINGNNYYRIRDLGTAIGFGVDFDAATMTVQLGGASGTSDPEDGTVSPVKPNDDVVTTGVPTKYTFEGTGWGHNVGMSQYGALCMAKQGFKYDEILKFYYTDIAIAK